MRAKNIYEVTNWGKQHVGHTIECAVKQWDLFTFKFFINYVNQNFFERPITIYVQRIFLGQI